jgi:hypothetical protein
MRTLADTDLPIKACHYAENEIIGMVQRSEWGAQVMRLFAAVFVVLLSVVLQSWGTQAMAQGYCPFTDFCGEQHHRCYRNCGGLGDAIAWPSRPRLLQQCTRGCERQFNRCMYRAVHRCR